MEARLSYCIEFSPEAEEHSAFLPARQKALVLNQLEHRLAHEIRGQFTPPTAKGPAWTHPVVHEGKLCLRHDNLLLCYELRAE